MNQETGPSNSAALAASHAAGQSSALVRFAARRGIHYGWVVAGATFMVMLVTAGAAGAPGVLLVPLQKEFGWTAAQVSSSLGLRLALFGLTAPFAAALMNRFGLRAVVLASLGLITAGMGLSIFMTELWQLVALWGVAVGFGAGLTALVLAATVSARWFERRRGLVVGLLTASSATGQLIILPVMAAAVDAVGWRGAIGLMCCLYALAALAAALLLRNSPADVGLRPYGALSDPAPAPPQGANLFLAPFAALRDAAGKPVFWILFGTFFICGASTNGLVQMHLIPLCGDFGIAATRAAGLLALMGVFDFFGTIASGWLSDRYSNRWLLFWYYGLRGLSLIYLANSDFSLIGLAIFATFYGLDWIATVPPTVKLVAQHFGAGRANLVFGWVFAAHQIGAGTAALAAGITRTDVGSYLPAFFTAGVLCLGAALAALAIRPAGRKPVPPVAPALNPA
jgi:MFS family permease